MANTTFRMLSTVICCWNDIIIVYYLHIIFLQDFYMIYSRSTYVGRENRSAPTRIRTTDLDLTKVAL
ncbi:hypothetical protein ATCV1_z364L [Acanthocystis turfacea chlorella virus 1]|uniref:Uncharacterized protein z364L n=1 Tax=Chlorovirus heliozoae TaxID=322019 RepID=A7K8X4_9PHYC|nr:hypothetical protein ATCV1_z364L [Acanthocystis turfacea chlorella virus 1]ABT16498.1 hypothetical protein ATCV1_z364L [Acanthocystis turfacea chlorella virus 1]